MRSEGTVASGRSGPCVAGVVQRPFDLALGFGGEPGERDALVGRPHHQAGGAGEHRMVNHLVLYNGADFAQLVGDGAVGPAGCNTFL